MSTSVLGIGIETSCDESSLSIVKNGREIVAHLVFSQVDTHKQYGGVVPEVASRKHLEKMSALLYELKIKYSEEFHSVEYVAVTTRPGLVGSLLIGYNTALAIADYLKVPLLPIHHLEAHLYAVALEYDIEWRYPFIAGLFSGGHSSIFQVNHLGKFELLGSTLDDAAGEALDKAAHLLGLPYPGGPHIEKAANNFIITCKERGYSEYDLLKKNPLPRPLQGKRNDFLSFSFSGLKTALLYKLKEVTSGEDSTLLSIQQVLQLLDTNIDEEIFCSKEAWAYFFQNRIISSIVDNTQSLMDVKGTSSLDFIVMAGGVLANQTLQKYLMSLAETYNISMYIPSLSLCTDNGAMVAACGYQYYKHAINTVPVVTSNSSFENWLL